MPGAWRGAAAAPWSQGWFRGSHSELYGEIQPQGLHSLAQKSSTAIPQLTEAALVSKSNKKRPKPSRFPGYLQGRAEELHLLGVFWLLFYNGQRKLERVWLDIFSPASFLLPSLLLFHFCVCPLTCCLSPTPAFPGAPPPCSLSSQAVPQPLRVCWGRQDEEITPFPHYTVISVHIILLEVLRSTSHLKSLGEICVSSCPGLLHPGAFTPHWPAPQEQGRQTSIPPHRVGQRWAGTPGQHSQLPALATRGKQHPKS